MEAYGRALADVAATTQAIGSNKTIAHSLGALIKSYLASDVFATKAAETQRTRRNILERFAKEHGDKPLYHVRPTGDRVMLLKREHSSTTKARRRSRSATFSTRCVRCSSGQ
jgi:hypothetical protein